MTLQPLSLEHASPLFALIQENRELFAMRFPWVEQTQKVQDTEAFIQQKVPHRFAIMHDGQIAGAIDLRIDALNRRGEIGYYLGIRWQGRGIATTACKEIIAYAATLHLHRLEIRITPDNTKSIRVAERAGFTHEATLRDALFVQGRFHPVLLYALILQN